MTGTTSVPTPTERPRALDARIILRRALELPLRLRFLVALLAVIAVSETVIAVTFYNQQKQHSITERLVRLGDRMHHIADFQFSVAQVALQSAPVSGSQVADVRSELSSFQAAATPRSGQELQAQRSLNPRFEALVRARTRLDGLPRTSPLRGAAKRRLFRQASALLAPTAKLHVDADAHILQARATAEARQGEEFQTLVVGSAISLLAAIALALLLARTISRPVARLAAGARELGAGRLGHRLTVESRDEIGAMATEFNRMAAQLEEAQATLEQRVRERTLDLAEANRELDRHRSQQELLAQQRRELLKRLITAQEEERRRIAREVHNEAGQLLTALRLGLEAAEADLGSGRQESLARRLHSLSGVAVDTLEELDRLVLDLRPAQLDHLGLAATLHWYVTRFELQAGVRVKLEIGGQARRLDPEVETALFRIVQEALTNVARHASASQVNVELSFEPDSVSLDVADDGVGFDPETAGASLTSVGLLGMGEYADLVGGVLVVRSRPGEGTQLSVAVPLENEQP